MENEQKLWLGISISAFVALLIIVGGYNPADLLRSNDDDELYSTATSKHPLAKDCLGGHENQLFHYHAELQIYIDEQPVLIPGDVGLNDGECSMRLLHTHSENGVIHIELKQQADAPLEAFFDVWGKHFDKNGFDTHRVNSTHELVMEVNGEINNEFNNYILNDDPNNSDRIIIRYQERS